MKKINIFIVLLMILFTPVVALFGQDNPTDPIKSHEVKSLVIDKKFIFLNTALFATSSYDLETTFKCVEIGRCREANLLMAPFIKSGRPAAYGVTFGVNAGLVYYGYYLKKHKNPEMRKIWWLPAVASIAVHTIAGSFNLRFVF